MEVAGHSLRTGKPSCQPSRTHAPWDVLWQPTPQPKANAAGTGITKVKKPTLRQRWRSFIVVPVFELAMTKPFRGRWFRVVGRLILSETVMAVPVV